MSDTDTTEDYEDWADWEDEKEMVRATRRVRAPDPQPTPTHALFTPMPTTHTRRSLALVRALFAALAFIVACVAVVLLLRWVLARQ